MKKVKIEKIIPPKKDLVFVVKKDNICESSILKGNR